MTMGHLGDTASPPTTDTAAPSAIPASRVSTMGMFPSNRRQRFLATFFYELPVGKGETFLNSANGLVDRVLGGWVLSGVILCNPAHS